MSRDARSRVADLENQVTLAKILARRFWRVLATRVDMATQVLFVHDLSPESRRVVDVAFDAAEIVWQNHRVVVEPCRRLLDPPSNGMPWDWPTQDEMFVARYPGGETKNISRDQLMMMAGMDIDTAEDAAA